MRWMVKLKLCLTGTRGHASYVKMLILILVAGIMLHFNWSNPFVAMECKTSCEEDDFLSCSQNGVEVITKSGVREMGKPPTRKVLLTIGIPTVQRIFKNKTVSYLTETLNSLLNNKVSDNDLADLLIVVFLADTEEAPREEVKRTLRSKFGKYLDMNLIHVIAAPASFYPQLKGLKRTLNDGQERMYWRSKQSMDYVFMFYYSQGLSQYYLHLEDDVTAEPNYMTQIRDFIARKGDTKWDVLAFSEWGFIGKLFQDKDLRKFGRFITMFYNEMPVDWILLFYMKLRGGTHILDNKNLTWETELFHHIGHQSSSLGT